MSDLTPHPLLLPGTFPHRPLSARAQHWQLRSRRLSFTPLPLWMGIVNVTPDSFSDGGKFAEVDQAVTQALDLVEQGADLLDIGGESTRPYASPVSADEELQRVMPVIERLVEQTDCPLSIDTSKTVVAREAIAAGVEVVNDITGLTGESGMLPLVAEAGVGVCAMHMQGTPATMQDSPAYSDVATEIYHYLAGRRDAIFAAGVEPHRLCLDPGIGFGKTHAHNLALMQACEPLHELGCPLLVGHSRKGFLGQLLGDSKADRSAATVGAALALARQGVQVIRLHEVRPAREAMLAFAASGGLGF